MHRLRITLILIALLALAAVAGAAAPAKPAAPPKTSADVVLVSARPGKVQAKPGATVVFFVAAEIAKGWHLYAHSYAEDPESTYIGIDLTPAEGCPLTDLKVVYPDPVKGKFLGEEALMHAGALSLKVTATVPATAKGEFSAELTLVAQACNDKICLRPADIPVKVTVVVK